MNTSLHYPVELRLKRPVSAYWIVAIFICILVGAILIRTLSIGYVIMGIGIIELLFAWRFFGGYYVKIAEDRITVRHLFSGNFKTSDISKVVYISHGYTIHLKAGREYRIELENMDPESQEKARAYFEPMVKEHIT